MALRGDALESACESFWKVAKSKLDLDIVACAKIFDIAIEAAEASDFVGLRNALVHERDPRKNKRADVSPDKAGILESYRRVLLVMDKLMAGYFCGTMPTIDRGELVKNGGLKA
jgi:hypothetical protein